MVEPRRGVEELRCAEAATRRVQRCRRFRIGDDGRLTFVRKDDIDVGSTTMFWMGMVQL